MNIGEEQVERVLDKLDRIGSELDRLTSAVDALCSAIGGVGYAITEQTNTLKDSITDLTVHVAMRCSMDDIENGVGEMK